MSNCASSQPCIGSGSTLGASDTAELIKVNLCQPLRQACNSGTSTIFTAPELPSINGVFTLTNTGSLCTITVEVTDAQGTQSYEILPLSSVGVFVTNVTLIEYFCTGNSDDFCTGAFEANFFYFIQ